MGKSSSKAARDNRSNQMNPNNPAHSSSRSYVKATGDNNANQLNPNNDAYRLSRGVERTGREIVGYVGGAPRIEWDSVPPPNNGSPSASGVYRQTKLFEESESEDED